MSTLRTICFGLAILAASGPASATGEIEGLITSNDRDRLAAYDATRRDALETARAGGAQSDVATLDRIANAEPVSFQDFDLNGNWRCRTIKAGGPAELVVYGWFKCRVTDDGSGWRLEKITGSQRTTGRFFTESDTRLTYLGSLHINEDAAKPYGSGPENDQVGVVERTGPRSWKIEFPAPFYESKLDILELRR